MGENRASGEGILCGFIIGEVVYVKDESMLIMLNIVHLHSFCADKLKSVHSMSFDYNKCKIKINFEAALMVKTIIGEKNCD